MQDRYIPSRNLRESLKHRVWILPCSFRGPARYDSALGWLVCLSSGSPEMYVTFTCHESLGIQGNSVAYESVDSEVVLTVNPSPFNFLMPSSIQS
jgi:hypothetical protein